MGVREFTVAQRGIGLPDYAVRKPVGTVPVGPIYTSTDIAELAARLGSIVTFDRRGNVLFLDDFKDGIAKWTKEGSGAGEGIEWTAEYIGSGGFAAKLYTGATTGNYAQMSTSLPYPVLSKLGFEASFSIDMYLDHVSLLIHLATGTQLATAIVEWEQASRQCLYFGSDGDYHALTPAISLLRVKEHFNTAKLVIDPLTWEYVRLILNNTAYDLSNKAFKVVDSIAAPYLDCAILIATNADHITTAYVDKAIKTQNEPANPLEGV